MKTIYAAAAVALVLAGPAFAAEEYQSGPALALTARVVATDTGSAQLPRFDGQQAVVPSRSQLVPVNGAEASVESANSQPAALGQPATRNLFAMD